MKVIGILGLLLLLVGLLLGLVGVGGAVVNFGFPPTGPVCRIADKDYEAAKKAVSEYEAAKGTANEYLKEADAKRALDSARASQDSCGRMKETYRFYGVVFSGVGFVGMILTVIGAVAAFLGLRRKKRLA